MKNKQFREKLRESHNLELEQMLNDHKEELFSLRFQVATGHLEDTSRVKAVKKTIAKIKTILRARELQIEETPTSVA
ncbi:MAG TPA: 50S ribosomal protein L29 [Candidatus Eremiobacteraeota bacterium]|nr:MAG: 50S ribosomal protein L29 [bacterium ADurb.Bin363]HPZ08164.1 50S ribosomal protein L29 [Candidatus Eremiobacteraeota bacterium]